MELLNAKQVDQVNDALVSHGVSYDALRDNLLDHICCMIEQGVADGQTFPDSLDAAIEKFGVQNFKLIQESTLFLINQKLNKMKKFTSIMGLIASVMVIGAVVFKANHLFGANILLVLGLALISLIVLPLMAYINIVSKESKQTIVSSTVGYLAGVVLTIGVLCKLMMWPYNNILLVLGGVLLLFVFMPLYSINSYRLAENKLFALTKSMLMVAAFFLLWWFTMARLDAMM